MPHETSLFGLTGRKLLIIGGGQGMGEATASFAARAGADVALMDIVQEPAEAVAAMVASHGCRAGLSHMTFSKLS